MFVAIRDIIEADGSEEEKTKLHALAYYRPLFDNNEQFAQHKQHPLNTVSQINSLSLFIPFPSMIIVE